MELLNNLTSWTRIQTGRILFNPRETDLNHLIKEVTESCKAVALMKSVTIKVSSPGELIVLLDRVIISTILRNLVINAIKFSYHNSEVHVNVIRKDSIIELGVVDCGTGIDARLVNKILNMDKVDSTPGTANEKGTGLGLSLCMELIAMHRCTLNLESEPGKGSRFIVSIPVR